MSRKQTHMQYYSNNSTYGGFTFCQYPLYTSATSDLLVTTQWSKCTCKNCLRYKKDAGNPA